MTRAATTTIGITTAIAIVPPEPKPPLSLDFWPEPRAESVVVDEAAAAEDEVDELVEPGLVIYTVSGGRSD